MNSNIQLTGSLPAKLNNNYHSMHTLSHPKKKIRWQFVTTTDLATVVKHKFTLANRVASFLTLHVKPFQGDKVKTSSIMTGKCNECMYYETVSSQTATSLRPESNYGRKTWGNSTPVLESKRLSKIGPELHRQVKIPRTRKVRHTFHSPCWSCSLQLNVRNRINPRRRWIC